MALKSVIIFTLVAFVAPAGVYAGEGREGPDFEAYYQLVDSGDTEGAERAAGSILTLLIEGAPESSSLKSCRARIDVIVDARLRVSHKMELLAQEGKPSPFALYAPTPAELNEEISAALFTSRVDVRGLSDEHARFVKSADQVALRESDRLVLASYRETAAKAGEEAADAARGYLAAYVLGSREAEELERFLPRLAEAVGNPSQAPVFLLEKAILALESFSTANTLVDMLDRQTALPWPPGERVRILQLMSEKAQDAEKVNWAVAALYYLGDESDQNVAEKALYRAVELLKTNAKTLSSQRGRRASPKAAKAAYGEAADACEKYLLRFPKGKNAVMVEYKRVNLLMQADKSEEAVAAARKFRENHPGSRATTSLMLVEALSLSDLRRTDEAIDLFNLILKDYPKSKEAGYAQYVIGYIHLNTQKYSEAREAFQRVVDFYPNSTKAEEARGYLNRLASLIEKDK